MKFEESDAWIFLAIEQVAFNDGARVASISLAADGINHAVPLEREMNGALKRLASAGLIERKGRKYFMTESGKTFSKLATSPTLLARMKEVDRLLRSL